MFAVLMSPNEVLVIVVVATVVVYLVTRKKYKQPKK